MKSSIQACMEVPAFRMFGWYIGLQFVAVFEDGGYIR